MKTAVFGPSSIVPAMNLAVQLQAGNHARIFAVKVFIRVSSSLAPVATTATPCSISVSPVLFLSTD
jgi:hypothetical protein